MSAPNQAFKELSEPERRHYLMALKKLYEVGGEKALADLCEDIVNERVTSKRKAGRPAKIIVLDHPSPEPIGAAA